MQCSNCRGINGVLCSGGAASCPVAADMGRRGARYPVVCPRRSEASPRLPWAGNCWHSTVTQPLFLAQRTTHLLLAFGKSTFNTQHISHALTIVIVPPPLLPWDPPHIFSVASPTGRRSMWRASSLRSVSRHGSGGGLVARKLSNRCSCGRLINERHAPLFGVSYPPAGQPPCSAMVRCFWSVRTDNSCTWFPVSHLPTPSPVLCMISVPFPGQELEVKLIRDRHRGIVAGYGFIDFRNHETAQLVLDSLNGKPIGKMHNNRRPRFPV